ncbi:VOC family protein [Roseospira goensis]|uniref:Catechol 2,3-dioxygenase-like lactoylglutathione lyase family enzyme n=1 Tax=Roseospira goensis TaxID=391922 RepID=A0A7W6S120_9PROT|nr:VOC family protein [Roseospira goensis]MBB4286751.1 catechol 2,3-dioxygenase-like lactoylglutathione lyase family enzyme [Roseospira goensis]
MRLYGIRLFVDDLDAARRFYGATLGLPLAWDAPDEGAVGFAAGDGHLIVERADPDGPDGALVGRFVGASLEVPDAVALYQALAARGVVFDMAPAVQPWGGVMAHFRDPAGNVLTLISPPPGATAGG